MPKVTFSIRRRSGKAALQSTDELDRIGLSVRILVAEAMSTEAKPLGLEDVDWIPQFLPEGSHAAPVGFEIEAIGYPDRKKKFWDPEVARGLKCKILEKLKSFGLDPNLPLVWIKFWDPDGPHI